MHDRKIGIESDGAPQPRNGVFVRVKMRLGSAGEIHPNSSARVARRKSKRFVLFTLDFLGRPSNIWLSRSPRATEPSSEPAIIDALLTTVKSRLACQVRFSLPPGRSPLKALTVS